MKQEEIRDKLTSTFGKEVVLSAAEFRGEISVLVASDRILDVCKFLRDDPELSFDFLSFVGGIDRTSGSPRFELAYQLYSTRANHRFRVITAIEDTGKGAVIDSVFSIWTTADWHERETAEMFGIKFRNHPDPRKLLLPEEWKVFPLRKDFPLLGTEEDTPDLPRRPDR